jgi:phage-related protein
VREFIDELPLQTRIEVLTLLRRMENGEILPMPHSRSLASMAKGLYELRLRDVAGQVRIFYYTKIKDVIFLVHALRKKTRTMPEKDRILILKRLQELGRIK